jgi:hypothetical protein
MTLDQFAGVGANRRPSDPTDRFTGGTDQLSFEGGEGFVVQPFEEG